MNCAKVKVRHPTRVCLALTLQPNMNFIPGQYVQVARQVMFPIPMRRNTRMVRKSAIPVEPVFRKRVR